MSAKNFVEGEDYAKDERGCWIWLKYINKGGYGTVWYKNKKHAAHRVSYLIYKGDIPEGLDVCHTCDVRRCINPDHLFVGTRKDNMVDASNKGKLNKQVPLSIIEDIVHYKKTYNFTQEEIAEIVGLHQTTISKLLKKVEDGKVIGL